MIDDPACIFGHTLVSTGVATSVRNVPTPPGFAAALNHYILRTQPCIVSCLVWTTDGEGNNGLYLNLTLS